MSAVLVGHEGGVCFFLVNLQAVGKKLFLLSLDKMVVLVSIC